MEYWRLLEIIGWGLILAGIILILLEIFGILHSPSALDVNNLITAGILTLLVEMRVKIELLWQDFKKRKRL